MTPASRAPAVSGTFYPALPGRLRADVTKYLVAAERPARVPAVIAPHAGYVYSGATAGVVFGAVEIPATCVVLAPNHTGRLGAPNGASALVSLEYRTPLGDVPLDRGLADRILDAAGGLADDDPAAHSHEHAVEVMLPFLQMRREDVRIVPIVLAWNDWPRAARLARAIHDAVGARDDVLLVASSDMNHYESADVGQRKDEEALERVVELDGEGLLDVTRRKDITMCGRVPAACACEYARLRAGADARGEVIAYAHSGLVNGDLERVVGYAGVLLGLRPA